MWVVVQVFKEGFAFGGVGNKEKASLIFGQRGFLLLAVAAKYCIWDYWFVHFHGDYLLWVWGYVYGIALVVEHLGDGLFE